MLTAEREKEIRMLLHPEVCDYDPDDTHIEDLLSEIDRLRERLKARDIEMHMRWRRNERMCNPSHL